MLHRCSPSGTARTTETIKQAPSICHGQVMGGDFSSLLHSTSSSRVSKWFLRILFAQSYEWCVSSFGAIKCKKSRGTLLGTTSASIPPVAFSIRPSQKNSVRRGQRHIYSSPFTWLGMLVLTNSFRGKNFPPLRPLGSHWPPTPPARTRYRDLPLEVHKG